VRALLDRTEGEDSVTVIPPELRELWRAIEPHIVVPSTTRTEEAAQ
jgi:hypothetical protein